MNLFIGDYKTFYKFFGGYARNHTLYLTKKYKSGVCACCGATDKEIESAHKRGLERSELVKNFFHESVFKEENGNYYVDLDKFEESFVNFSKDISNFHFLCKKCHTQYDAGEIDENDFVYKDESIKNIRNRFSTTRTSKRTTNNGHTSINLEKEYFLHSRKCSNKEFEQHLRDASLCTVFVTLFYGNKPSTQHVWQVSNFKPTSNLSGNLHSGFLRDWQAKGITGIKLEIK